MLFFTSLYICCSLRFRRTLPKQTALLLLRRSVARVKGGGFHIMLHGAVFYTCFVEVEVGDFFLAGLHTATYPIVWSP